jgi:hypothetical protein
MSSQQADSWRLRCLNHLEAVRAGILDLIDVGSRPVEPPARRPSAVERESTDVASGRFEPTPMTGFTVRTSRSDPTYTAVAGWERDVTSAVTGLWGLVTAVEGVAGTLALTVPFRGLDGHTAPREPATELTVDGRIVVAAGPAACRRHTLDACEWLEAAIGVLAERMVWADTPDVIDHLADTGRQIEHALASLARRWRIPCACGCGLPAPDVGRRTREACRKRSYRQRLKAAS